MAKRSAAMPLGHIVPTPVTTLNLHDETLPPAVEIGPPRQIAISPAPPLTYHPLMLAFAGVWIAFASFVVALAMLVYRPAMTDLSIWLVLWLGAPLSMCFAGLILWAYRKDVSDDPAITAQRTQAKVALALSITAAAIVYVLIIYSEKFIPIEA